MRTTDKKNPPLITPRGWAMITMLLVLALISATIYYFTLIQEPKWDEMKTVKQRLSEANVVEWELLSKYVWDEVVWIAEGASVDQNKSVVFLRTEEPPIIINEDQILSRAQIEATFRQAHQHEEELALLSSRIGLLAGQPVWEIYYKIDQKFYYYFYDAATGVKIDNYRLMNKL